LLALKHDVTIITNNINDTLKNKIFSLGGDVKIAHYKMHRNKFKAILATFLYRLRVKKILNEFKNQQCLLWVEGNYTILSLYGIINKFKYILQIQELHKNIIEYLAIKKYISNATIVFMPEYNRAFFFKILFKLESLPIVLHNKPEFIPSSAEIESLKYKYCSYLKFFKNKKILLYQGGLSTERDLSPFLRAINKLDDSYGVIFLGQDYGVIDRYKKLCSRLVHIPYVSAPDYLVFTSMAYIGIVTYVGDTLNNAYCAPNKIFEYSAFSIPMIGNDIPGLRYPFLEYNIGVIVNINDESSIRSAIEMVERNYSKFSKQSSLYYKKINNQETLKNALKASCSEKLPPYFYCPYG
jgi:glycosyltransferase involved in cell wall biosynthesis